MRLSQIKISTSTGQLNRGLEEGIERASSTISNYYLIPQLINLQKQETATCAWKKSKGKLEKKNKRVMNLFDFLQLSYECREISKDVNPT